MITKSFFVSLSKLSSSILNLLFMIFCINYLEKNENGKLQYLLGLLPVFLAIAEFGLPNSLVKFITSNLHNRIKIFNYIISSLLIKILVLLSSILIFILFKFFFSTQYNFVIILIFGGFVLSFISYFESLFVSFGSYTELSIWFPIPNLIRLCMFFLLSSINNIKLDSIDILSIYCYSPILSFLFLITFIKIKNINWNFNKNNIFKSVKELSSFNYYSFLASIFAISSDRIELYFLNRYHPPTEVANYGTALQLFSGFLIIFSTINSFIYPKLSSLSDFDEFKKILKQSLKFVILLSIVLSPGFFLAKPVLELFFGLKYLESIPVFKILYPNYLLQLIFMPLGIALFALGKPKILALLAFIRLLMGAFFDYLIIPNNGSMGASLAFLLGQTISWTILILLFIPFIRGKKKSILNVFED